MHPAAAGHHGIERRTSVEFRIAGTGRGAILFRSSRKRIATAMLKITGPGSITTCDGLTRRDFLQVGTLGALGFSMTKLMAAQEAGAIPKGADVFSLVRSVYHTAAEVHDTGHQMMQTGRLFTGVINTPHAGCALEFLKGRRNELPAHVLLPQPMGPTGGNLPHGQDAGFLGKAYDPFVLNADPSKKDFKVPDLLPPSEIGEARLQRRRELRQVVDDTVKNFEASESAKLMDANFSSAYRLMTSAQARDAFDLTKEPLKVR